MMITINVIRKKEREKKDHFSQLADKQILNSANTHTPKNGYYCTLLLTLKLLQLFLAHVCVYPTSFKENGGKRSAIGHQHHFSALLLTINPQTITPDKVKHGISRNLDGH